MNKVFIVGLIIASFTISACAGSWVKPDLNKPSAASRTVDHH